MHLHGRGAWLRVGLLLALWMNLHGMYVVGYVWLGLQLLGGWLDRLRGRPVTFLSTLGSMAVGLSGVLVHPRGLGILTYPLHYQFGAVTHGIEEWLPPDPSGAHGRFLVSSVLIVLVLLARSRPAGAAWVTAVGMGYLAFTSRRHAPLFGLAMVPFVSAALAQLIAAHRRDGFWWRRFDNYNLVALMSARSIYSVGLALVLGVFFLAVNPAGGSADTRYLGEEHERIYPRAAVEALRAQPGHADWRIFNDYRWGGYLLYEGPIRTFVDGRTDLFMGPVLTDYHRLYGITPEWRDVLARYRIDAALIRSGHPLERLLEREGWRVVHRDRLAVLLRAGEPVGSR